MPATNAPGKGKKVRTKATLRYSRALSNFEGIFPLSPLFSQRLSRFYPAIHAGGGPTAAGQGSDGFDGASPARLHAVAGTAGGMGREDDILQFEQRVVGRWGLLLEDVETGGSNPAFGQGANERGLL